MIFFVPLLFSPRKIYGKCTKIHFVSIFVLNYVGKIHRVGRLTYREFVVIFHFLGCPNSHTPFDFCIFMHHNLKINGTIISRLQSTYQWTFRYGDCALVRARRLLKKKYDFISSPCSSQIIIALYACKVLKLNACFFLSNLVNKQCINVTKKLLASLYNNINENKQCESRLL